MSVTNVIITDLFKKVFLSHLLAACFFFSLSGVSYAMVEELGKVSVEIVAILTNDELGEEIRYPSSVFYDYTMDETYVVGGNQGKVIVYGANFFPLASLGKGRGATAPRSGYIYKSNTLFLCQDEQENLPPRLTAYNLAFFPEKEILLTSIPDHDTFTPKNMTIGITGNIYITGQGAKGVLVLDKEGNFSHWLNPLDKILVAPSKEMTIEEAATDSYDDLMASTQEETELEDNNDDGMNMRDLLPPDLLPTIEEDSGTTTDQELLPVQVIDVKTDSAGHLYILSEETSKVYVYSHSEELLFSFGQKGGSTGKMSRPKSLVVDEKKNALYIVDYMRHTILIYDLSGRFMYEFGGLGTGPGWFQYPIAITLNKNSNLIVADLFNHRVQVLDVKFEYKFPLFQSPEQEQETMPGKEPEETVPGVEEKDGDIYFPQPIYL